MAENPSRSLWSLDYTHYLYLWKVNGVFYSHSKQMDVSTKKRVTTVVWLIHINSDPWTLDKL